MCNNACHTCPRPAGAAPADSSGAHDASLQLELPPGERGPLVLHGGEPTLHPDFQALLVRAREAGVTLIVDSNARAFAVPGRATQARQAGLAHAQVTLHGAREASHDFLTRVPGSFRQAVAGATQLRVAGVRLTARVLVTRTVVRELGAMTTLALGLGAQAVRFSWARMEPRPPGFAPPERPAVVDDPRDPKGPLKVDPNTPAGDRTGYDQSREWLVPRYPLAAEALAAAVRAVTKLGRTALVDGIPACLAPHGATVATSPPACFAPIGPVDSYAAPCEGCAARTGCPGIPLGYLARFGSSELQPRPR